MVLRKFRQAPILLLMAALAGCGEAQEVAEVPKQLLGVHVKAAEKQEIAPVLELSGWLAAKEPVAISFRVAGEVTTRNVSIGQRVEPGDILAELDPAMEEQDLLAANAAFEAAQAELRLAQSAYDRQKTLLDKGVVTRAAFERAGDQLKLKQAALKQATSRRDIASQNREFTVLKADMAGTVMAVNTEPGQFVQSGQSVFTLAADKGLQAVFDVPVALVDQGAGDGEAIDLRLVNNPQIVARARLAEFSPVVSKANGTIRIKLDVNNPPPEMKLGLAVVAEAKRKSVEGFVFPVNAVASLNGETALWVVNPDDNQVEMRAVEISGLDDARVTVTSGISKGDLVVTTGTQFLSVGQKVAPDVEG